MSQKSILVPYVSSECVCKAYKIGGRDGRLNARMGRGFVFVEVSVVIEEYFRDFDDLARRLLW